MSERVLVPYDGSPPAEEALEYTFETFPDADVTALFVVPTREGYWAAFDGEVKLSEKDRERGAALLEDAAAIAADRDRELRTELVAGKPARDIVEHADEGEYDVVVIGSHGREGVSRVLLGSVAETVARRSPTPVLIVR